MSINKRYLILTICLFIVEVLIALYLHDKWIRPYGGDVLVVILIYCFIKTFWDTPYFKTALGVLLFAFFVEILQYFKFVKFLGLQNNKLAVTVIGDTYHWKDLISYVIGTLIILAFELIRTKTRGHNNP